jgi:hypothetical protein
MRKTNQNSLYELIEKSHFVFYCFKISSFETVILNLKKNGRFAAFLKTQYKNQSSFDTDVITK